MFIRIYQFYGNASYRCAPPTFKNYRLYTHTISGFNLKKRIRLITYALIPYEAKVTYLILFNNLKEKF